MTNDTMTVDPAATASCPKCAGTGRIKFTRPGGWLSERCTPCSGRGTVDPETARTLALLIRNGTAALGDVDGKCCDPAEGNDSPCIACSPPDLFPDEVVYEPTEADAAWYARWLGYRDGRIEPGPTFVEEIYECANDLCESANPVWAWIGQQVACLGDQARFFGATSPESFADRKDACLDAAREAAEARAAARAMRAW